MVLCIFMKLHFYVLEDAQFIQLHYGLVIVFLRVYIAGMQVQVLVQHMRVHIVGMVFKLYAVYGDHICDQVLQRGVLRVGAYIVGVYVHRGYGILCVYRRVVSGTYDHFDIQRRLFICPGR